MSFALFIVYILCTYLRPFEVLAPEANVFRPMLILMALAFAASSPRAISRREWGARPVHFGLLGLLVLAIGMSQVANHWAGGALVAIADFSASAMLMVLCLFNLTSIKRLQVTCVAIVCSVVILAALGVFSWHTGFMADELVLRQNAVDEESVDPAVLGGERIEIPAHDDTGRYFLRLRSLGFLNDPNDFAQVMVMVLPLLWWTIVPGRLLRNFLIVGVPGAVLAYAIYLTHSRGAYFGVAAILLLAAHRALGTLKTLALVFLAAGAMGIISIGGRELSSKEESAAQRVDAWFAGWTMLKSQPLFGVGYGNFTDHHYLTAHNSFVLCFSELGLFGYFAWLGLIVLTFEGLNRAVRYAPQDTPERKLAVILRASLAGYMACAWFLSRSYQPGLYVVLALGIAAWVCARNLIGPAAQQPPIEPIPWARTTLIAMAVSIMAVYFFIALQQVGG
jgi:putative inorganic carbon (hco3(-)) transporter